MDGRRRCDWAAQDDLLARYHDEEWGVPPAGDAGYFEALSLEVFQSGLSWRTILHKREGFRRAFAGFDIATVAEMTPADVERLLADPSIVRHRRKIEATIANARAFRQIQREAGSFADWLAALPPDTDAVYRALRPHVVHVGRTTCESFLEAVGRIATPHDPWCWKSDGRAGA